MPKALETRIERLERQTATLNQLIDRYPALTGDSKTWLDLFPEVKALLEPNLPQTETELFALLVEVAEKLDNINKQSFGLEIKLSKLNSRCDLLLNYLGYDPLTVLAAPDPAATSIPR